ncbi:hypothetical protein AYL99_04948 [Fonsecaea erecta]|uniref:Uncharacterized protein n=1 Tax=Fonsecaea erecta TaxID=1367422 RepID=A0A178ZKL4_9EURO|nr:hypothetical protein AYL99_04948 [Fonsecaea erecta]OAP59946.1 hypothetical protein AYL99_04948 [Fonsecaea erecta]
MLARLDNCPAAGGGGGPVLCDGRYRSPGTGPARLPTTGIIAALQPRFGRLLVHKALESVKETLAGGYCPSGTQSHLLIAANTTYQMIITMNDVAIQPACAVQAASQKLISLRNLNLPQSRQENHRYPEYRKLLGRFSMTLLTTAETKEV